MLSWAICSESAFTTNGLLPFISAPLTLIDVKNNFPIAGVGKIAEG